MSNGRALTYSLQFVLFVAIGSLSARAFDPLWISMPVAFLVGAVALCWKYLDLEDGEK